MNTPAHDNFQTTVDALSSGLLTPDDLWIISGVLRAAPGDISYISALKKGMTNRSFLFSCRGNRYIMRIPGEGTGRLISRPEEAAAYRAVRGTGLDRKSVV